MSAAFLLSYAPFKYFAGGDLTDWADADTRPWMNALTPAATAAGPVHVSTVPHHGMFDSLAGRGRDVAGVALKLLPRTPSASRTAPRLVSAATPCS